MAINLTGHDDSQLIFGTRNDRGTPLLKADLIKNWVCQVGEKVGADVEPWPETHWADFDDEWWREEISHGRQLRSRIDIFLQYWLRMRLRDEVTTEQVFRQFKEHARSLMSDAAGAENLLGQLRSDADTFRSFAQFSEGTAEGTFYSRVVETMELAATSPLLLWMLSETIQSTDAAPIDVSGCLLTDQERFLNRVSRVRIAPGRCITAGQGRHAQLAKKVVDRATTLATTVGGAVAHRSLRSPAARGRRQYETRGWCSRSSGHRYTSCAAPTMSTLSPGGARGRAGAVSWWRGGSHRR